MVIYRITNTINGKVYIGQTTQKLSQRWSRHMSNARRGAKEPLYHAIRKYGIDNFKCEEIAGANSNSELNYKEVHHIHKNNSISPNGYNLKLSNQIHTSTRIKVSEAMKANCDLNKMRKLTELSKEKSTQKIKSKDYITGEEFIFSSLKECEKVLGISAKHLSAMLSGKRPYKVYKRYWFEYVNKPTIKIESNPKYKNRYIEKGIF